MREHNLASKNKLFIVGAAKFPLLQGVVNCGEFAFLPCMEAALVILEVEERVNSERKSNPPPDDAHKVADVDCKPLVRITPNTIPFFHECVPPHTSALRTNYVSP